MITPSFTTVDKIMARTLALEFAGKESRWVRVPGIPGPS
jgi:hypothetical protein